MRRPTPPGTPTRSTRYIFPGSRSRLFTMSLAGALVLLGLVVVLYGVGFRSVMSPGAVASAHAGIDAKCAQCHQPAKAATDLRCERCHDPVDARRFGSPAHAALGGGGTWPAAHVAQVECAVCHVEHGGRGRDLKLVVNERCTSCHSFSSFTRHPEFALVKAKVEPDTGIDFSHEIHLREVAKIGVDRCQTCHQASADGRGFEPIAFDTHCAKCHIKDGVLTLNGTDPLKGTPTPVAALLPASEQLPAPSMTTPDERGRVTLDRFRHRDAWTLATAGRLTRTIAGSALASDRRRLANESARLSAIAQATPLSILSDEDLTRWTSSLQNELAALDRQIAAGPSAGGDSTAGLAAVAGAVDPSLAPLVSQAGAMQPAGADPAGGRPATPQDLDERRREIDQLLSAVSARTTGALAARAAQLKTELAGIKAGDAAGGATPDLAGFTARLDAVEAALRAAEPATSDLMAAELRSLGGALRQRMAGGLDPLAVATERAQLLTLLDTMSARATPLVRARIAELRAAVLPLVSTAGGLQTRRAEKARLFDRITLERELRLDGGPAPVDATTNAERTTAARELQRLRPKVAAIDADSTTIPEFDPGNARKALRGLLGACLACHRLNADETALRPVLVGRPTLTSATFTHKPHLLQARCETCHGTVATSKAGTDVNLPDVASCQSCHNNSQARADCASCHRYHPRSAAELVVALR